MKDALRANPVTPELQPVFNAFNVRVSPAAALRLDGCAGQDVLLGNEQAETLYGNAGNDVLFGGEGNDNLYDGNSDNANNLKDAGHYRPGVRFAAPIDNQDYHSRRLVA